MIRRKVATPRCRNKRETPIAATFLPLAKGDKRIVNMICHRHFSGWTVVGLNVKNLPVRAWTTVGRYVPFKSSAISSDKIRDVIYKIKPKLLYINDAFILKPIDQTLPMLPYFGPLSELLERLSSGGKSNSRKNKAADVPTYEEIQELDENITYRDYMYIYKR